MYAAAALLAAAVVSTTPTPKAPPEPQVQGKVMLKCTLNTDGSVRPCMVESEDPPGLGLGERALQLAARSRLNPAKGAGTVHVPMVFSIIDEPPAPPAR